MTATWWEALVRWCAVKETLPCLPACLPARGGSSVLYHPCFPLSCSQVFCLFFIVPFMCFPSLQKSLALFKIDSEQLPRLYPERERKTHGRQVPIELSKAFTPHQDLWIYQNLVFSGRALHVTIALPARATKTFLPRRAHLPSQWGLPKSAWKHPHKSLTCWDFGLSLQCIDCMQKNREVRRKWLKDVWLRILYFKGTALIK